MGRALVDSASLTRGGPYLCSAKNLQTLDPDDEAAYDLVIAVASGELEEVEEIAAVLRTFVRVT